MNFYDLPKTEQDALMGAVNTVYRRHDEQMPLNYVNVVEWAEAIVKAGFRMPICPRCGSGTPNCTDEGVYHADTCAKYVYNADICKECEDAIRNSEV